MQLSKVRLLTVLAFFLLFIVLQTVKGAKLYNAAIAAVSEDHPGGREGEEKLKVHTHSYCCIDYAQVMTVICLESNLNFLLLHFLIHHLFEPWHWM
jgi:hypothetical protein